jgi:hypothetical protein
MLRRRSLLLTLTITTLSSSPAWAQTGAAAAAAARGKIATFDGAGANAWAGNVRVSDEELVALLEEGVRRSPTFKALTERLSKSDVIVYVRPDVSTKSNSPTRLTFLSSRGGFRYLVVRVQAGNSKPQQISMLGHEMQHAVSIADASSVVDSQSLRKEFERIGKVTAASVGDDFSFESNIADEVRRRILSEVASDSGKAAPKVATATR